MTILKIGSFELPVCAGFDIAQRFEPIGGETILRAGTGRGIFQRTWRKTRVVTSGDGWVPPGLESIDNSATLALACIKERTVPAVFSTRQATLPTTRRADSGHLPYGLAQLADGQSVLAAASVVGNVATVAAVSGAVAYQVGYYPLLTCWIRRPVESGPGHSWEFEAEEV